MAPLDEVAYFIAGATLALLALWLLVLSPRQRATRAFAALLLGNACLWMWNLVEGLVPIDVRWALRAIGGIGAAAIGLASLYFLCVYPRPRGWVGRSRWSGWVALGLGAGIALLFLARPELYVLAERTATGFRLVDSGPLAPVTSLWTLTGVAMVASIAYDIVRAPAGPLRRALVLVFAGFITSIVAWTGSLVLNDVSGRLAPTAIDARFSRLGYVLEEVAFFLALGIATVVIARSWRSGDATVRREGQALAGLFATALAALAFAAFTFPPPGPEDWASVAQGILDASGGTAIALFVGYALLKHRLFDIEVKLKWTIRRGTVAAIFIGVFLAAAEIAKSFLSETQGYLAGGVAAGLLLFGVVPLQRWAERVADRALPAVHDSEDWRSQKKVELYRMAVGVALADRVVTREEERHLAKLAEELGLGAAQALALREDVEREMGLG